MTLRIICAIVFVTGFVLIPFSSFSQDSLPETEFGFASFYSKKWDGRKTSSGERLNSKKFTAAHKSLPFGTLVRVTNPENCNWVIVKINDRGPYIKNRIIDLSWGAAKELGIITSGISQVEIDVLK